MLSVACTMDSSFFSQQMTPKTFLIHDFAPSNFQNSWANKMEMRLYKEFGLIEHSYTYISSQRIFMWM